MSQRQPLSYLSPPYKGNTEIQLITKDQEKSHPVVQGALRTRSGGWVLGLPPNQGWRKASVEGAQGLNPRSMSVPQGAFN